MDLHNTGDNESVVPSEHNSPAFGSYYAFTSKETKNGESGKSNAPRLKHKVHNAVVVFCDLSNYQCLAEQYGDMMCTGIVEALFSQFDNIASDLQLIPLKTNGDQYIAVGFCCNNNLAEPSLHYIYQDEARNTFREVANHAIEFAIKTRNQVSSNATLYSSSCQLRVGIASGALLTGYSSRISSGFDIWGSTVNKAAMLEQFTAPNTIAICDTTYHILSTSSVKASNPVTEGSAYLTENTPALHEKDRKAANCCAPLSKNISLHRCYHTQIKVKNDLLNAYIF
tara:strand:+ start:301 stop:1149 length:849 start_codon:yes stop_codon:yes gene_type:complete